MTAVSHETQCITPRIAAQIEAKREGRRKHVRHGGTLCGTCLSAPPAPGRRQCNECHRLAQIRYRARQKIIQERNARIAAAVFGALEPQHNEKLSKGKDDGASEDQNRRPAAAADEDQPGRNSQL